MLPVVGWFSGKTLGHTLAALKSGRARLLLRLARLCRWRSMPANAFAIIGDRRNEGGRLLLRNHAPLAGIDAC